MSRVAPLCLHELSDEEERLDFFFPVVIVRERGARHITCGVPDAKLIGYRLRYIRLVAFSLIGIVDSVIRCIMCSSRIAWCTCARFHGI